MDKNENWTVTPGHGVVFGLKYLSSCSAAAFDLVVKYSIRIRTKNNVAGTIEDTIDGVCNTVIKYMIYCFVCAFGCVVLLGSKGTKADK